MLLCEKSMGVHTMEILMVLYHSLFVSVLLFNCQAWTRLTNQDLTRLRTIQLKYLKRCLQVPVSTTDVICFMELGIIPIEYEIDIRRIMFLYHIVQLEEDDPVRLVFKEQAKFIYENNWHNEIMKKLHIYNINYSEENIKKTSKFQWKKEVKEKITKYALSQMNHQGRNKSKAIKLLPYDKLNRQAYFNSIDTEMSRQIFKIRAGVFDIKTFCRYRYEDSICRLCGVGEEDIDHIIKECGIMLSDHQALEIEDFKNASVYDLRAITERLTLFRNKVNDRQLVYEQ